MAGTVLGTAPLGVGPFTAGTAATARALFFAALFVFAQRAFWAAAIFARASALMVWAALAVLGKLVPAGRPGFLFTVVLVLLKSALACCSREISASIAKTMSFVFMKSSATQSNPRIVPTPRCAEVAGYLLSASLIFRKFLPQDAVDRRQPVQTAGTMGHVTLGDDWFRSYRRAQRWITDRDR